MRLFLLYMVLPFASVSQSWLQLQDFPGTKRDDGIGVVVHNKGYFGTGLQEWNATIDFMEMDLVSMTWSTIPAMPNTTERQYACGFTGPDCFYVFGGTAGGDALSTLFKYSVVSKTWTEMSPKPGKGLIGAAVFQFLNKVVISNGKYTDNKPSYEVWEYNTSTDVWTALNPFPYAPVWRSSYASQGGYGYMLFGVDSTGKLRKEFLSYHPIADAWTVYDSFPGPGRAYAAMQSNNQNRLFVFGGMDTAEAYHKDYWSYEVAPKIWHRLTDMPSIGRRGGMSVSWNNSFFYTCGISQAGRLTETWWADLPTALPEFGNQRFELYPNPFSDHLTLESEGAEIENVEIFSSTGSKVFEGILEGTTLHLPEIPPGIYILKAQGKNGNVLVRKIQRQ